MKRGIFIKYGFNYWLINFDIHFVSRVFHKIQACRFLDHNKGSCKRAAHSFTCIYNSINIGAYLGVILYKPKLSQEFFTLCEIGGSYH